MNTLLGYIPFIDPINALHDFSYVLLIPLALGISIVYKAMRMTSLRRYWRHVFIMTAQIVFGMIGLALILTGLVQWVIPAV